MGTTARESPMEYGKGRNRWSDGRRPSTVVRRSAVHTPRSTLSASSAVVQLSRKLALRLDIGKEWEPISIASEDEWWGQLVFLRKRSPAQGEHPVDHGGGSARSKASPKG